MNQGRLFEGGRHLEQCPDDPPIDAFEMTFYTPWTILYAGELALEQKKSPQVCEALSTTSPEPTTLDKQSGTFDLIIPDIEA